MTASVLTTLELKSLTLRVKNLEAQLAFYRDLLGLEVVHSVGNRTDLSPAGRRFTLTLEHDPSALLRPQPTLGLYHFALLLPNRKALAAIFRRLVEAQYPHFQGASDHAVSEALYLSDPEGNGIELYRDRPRAEWPYRNGKLAMGSERMDLNALLSESQAGSLDPQTTFGHLHLHVGDLEQSQAFFEALGMQLTQGDYPGARFLSQDGYHHHVGINLWARGRTAPLESTGLIGYSIGIQGHSTQTLLDPNSIPVSIEGRP
jgi:catechol 2,3-dioxygenase